MYNEERKIRFINECGEDERYRNWGRAMFKCVGHMEEELGKDIAEMTADEVGQAFVTSDIVSSATLSNRIPFMVRYKAWCIDNGYPALAVKSGDIHVDMTDNIRDTMVYSEKQLEELMKYAFPEKTENDSKCLYKAHLWLGYAGMHDLDTVRVRASDIDFNQNSVFFENRLYIFPQEARRDIRHAIEMKVLVRATPDGKVKVFRRADNDKILRGRLMLNKTIDDKQYLMKTLRSTVNHGFAASGHIGMSFVRIRRSGIFREAFKREARGVPVSFFQVGHDDFVFEGKKATQGQTKQKILRRIILAYEKDYEAWKRAFAKELMEEFKLDALPHQFDW